MEEVLYNLENILSDIKFNPDPKIQWLAYDLKNMINDVKNIIEDHKHVSEI